MNPFQENSLNPGIPENLNAIEYMDVDSEELGSNEQNDNDDNEENPDGAIDDHNTEAVTIDQDTDMGSIDQVSDVILNDQDDEGPVLRRSARIANGNAQNLNLNENQIEESDAMDEHRGLRGTRRSIMRPRRSTRSSLRNLSRGIQTQYLRGQVTGVRPLQNSGQRKDDEAPRSPFKAFASFWIDLWNSFWRTE